MYHIDINNETYETVELLASGADALVSHATRVWKVKRVGSEEVCVLKDVWVDDDQDLEHATYEEILRDVERAYGKDIRAEVASHLITPIAHWLVRVNGEEDHTKKVILRGYSPSFQDKIKVNLRRLMVVDEEGSKVTRASDVEVLDSERSEGRCECDLAAHVS